MAYVSKVTAANEKLLYIFRPHWIYVLQGVFLVCLITFAGLLIDINYPSFVGQHSFISLSFQLISLKIHISEVSLIFFVMGLSVFWAYFLTYVSSEIGLTDQRIIAKRGLVFINIDQVDLEDIRAEHVCHGWFGWFLGYGRVELDCRFIDDVYLPAIRHPYRLIKASHNARIKHPMIEYGLDEFNERMQMLDQQRTKNRNKFHNLKAKIKSRFSKATS